MTKSEKIRELSKQGKTVEEIHSVVGGSVSYIYKIRSEMGKKDQGVFETALQRKIKKLSRSYTVSEIAEKVGCSRQYVHKVVKNQNHKILPFIEKYSEQDEYYTPLYAIIPIEKYLKRHSVIWCPFDTEESLFVRYFRMMGHSVSFSHIDLGQDFFEAEPPICDYIISNPPYSKKTEVFERLNELGLPYAMLVGSAGLFAAKARFDVFKNGIEQMNFFSRVGYMTDYNSGEILAHPPFESCYICKGILPSQLVFEELDKTKITL